MADRGHQGKDYEDCRKWIRSPQYEAERGTGCLRCGLHVDMQLSGRHPFGPTLDLIVPWSRGGPMTRENSARSHNRCNAGYRDGRRLRHLTTQRVVRRGPYSPSGTC